MPSAAVCTFHRRLINAIGLLLLSASACVPMVTYAPPSDCDDVSELFDVRTVLRDTGHACHDWLDRVHGRVARSPQGSVTIWTRLTASGAAVAASAAHTLSVTSLGTPGTAIDEMFFDPRSRGVDVLLTLIEPGGIDTSNVQSPSFLLFNPSIPAGETTGNFLNLTPRHDFYLSVLDSQQIGDGASDPAGPFNDMPPDLHDPSDATNVTPTFATTLSGDLVLIIGFPARVDGILDPGIRDDDRQYASVGRILDDFEAGAAVAALAVVGDEEGGIAYDPPAEMMIEGDALPGMSGGGVFNAEGALVGIIVRVTLATSLPTYVRAVRMTHIDGVASSAFNTLPVSDRAAVEPFFPQALDQP